MAEAVVGCQGQGRENLFQLNRRFSLILLVQKFSEVISLKKQEVAQDRPAVPAVETVPKLLPESPYLGRDLFCPVIAGPSRFDPRLHIGCQQLADDIVQNRR